MKKGNKKSEIVVSGLLDYLEETNQKHLLPEVTDSLRDLFKDRKKVKEIVVTSYVALTSKQKEDFRDNLKKVFNVNLPLVNNIDKDLIGGFTIQIGDWFFDDSISHELKNLKNTLTV